MDDIQSLINKRKIIHSNFPFYYILENPSKHFPCTSPTSHTAAQHQDSPTINKICTIWTSNSPSDPFHYISKTPNTNTTMTFISPKTQWRKKRSQTSPKTTNHQKDNLPSNPKSPTPRYRHVPRPSWSRSGSDWARKKQKRTKSCKREERTRSEQWRTFQQLWTSCETW